MRRIVIASNNVGKLREFRAILEPMGWETCSQKEAGFAEDVVENGTTFAENAVIKARAVQKVLHCPVIADDSGLMVDALQGAPGVYSHRFAGENATDAQRNEKLLEMLAGISPEKRTAQFVCVLCYIDERGEEHLFEGVCAGIIGTEPLGKNGFGYDPLFYSGEKTLAQMTDAEKNQISHRANALRRLEEYFENGSSLC